MGVLTGKKICIDAGHYGLYNRSPGVPEYYESTMAWKLHLLLKKYLEDLGAEVILTRPNQSVDKALKERGMTAADCDLFISIHSNAVGSYMNESVDYAAVYHLVADTTTLSDDVSKEIAAKLAPVIAEVMGTNQGYKILTRKSDNDRNGDGMFNDNYYGVLNGARLVDVPAVLLEHSFHTNTRMAKWLIVDSNLNKLAKAEAECIAEYFTGKPVSIGKKPSTDKLYRVQVGAFTVKKNADNLREALNAHGISAYTTHVGRYYKVQAGAFSNEANAEAMKAKIEKLGYDAIIV